MNPENSNLPEEMLLPQDYYPSSSSSIIILMQPVRKLSHSAFPCFPHIITHLARAGRAMDFASGFKEFSPPAHLSEIQRSLVTAVWFARCDRIRSVLARAPGIDLSFQADADGASLLELACVKVRQWDCVLTGDMLHI